MSEPLRTALDAGVLTLTLDRPDKRNALDTPTLDALHAALERADLDADVRVVAIRERGRTSAPAPTSRSCWRARATRRSRTRRPPSTWAGSS